MVVARREAVDGTALGHYEIREKFRNYSLNVLVGKRTFVTDNTKKSKS
jgi:hypothetical protein